MRISETKIRGVFTIDIDAPVDERGFFARTWDGALLKKHGLDGSIAQCSTSFNYHKGTVRGLHFQDPFPEVKMVRCTSGKIFDVAVDLRRDSPTYLSWVGIELFAANRRSLYIPHGCAHGFQTLEDNSEVFYQMSEEYRREAAKGVRFDDEAFKVTWPLPVTVISEKDRSWSNWKT